MVTLDEGSGLDVKGVVGFSLKASGVSGTCREAVESGFVDLSTDLSAVVSVQS